MSNMQFVMSASRADGIRDVIFGLDRGSSAREISRALAHEG
jgi:hypothetical protein